MIHVIATIEVVPGRRDEFIAEFQRNVPTSRTSTITTVHPILPLKCYLPATEKVMSGAN